MLFDHYTLRLKVQIFHHLNHRTSQLGIEKDVKCSHIGPNINFSKAFIIIFLNFFWHFLSVTFGFDQSIQKVFSLISPVIHVLVIENTPS